MATGVFPISPLPTSKEFLSRLLSARGGAMFDGWSEDGARLLLPWPEEILELPWSEAGRWLEIVRALEPSQRHMIQSPHRFSSGWVGYVSYDAGALSLGASAYQESPPESPLFFARHERCIVIARDGSAFLVCDERARDRALRELQTIVDTERARAPFSRVAIRAMAAVSDDEYRHQVEHVRHLIRDGEVYQVNLTRSFRRQGEVDPLDLYFGLIGEQPPARSAFLECGDYAIASASPETFLTIDRVAGTATSRPIKGTIAKTGDVQADMKRLLESRKDAAEHLMIVDLVRNDLGRIAPPGNVEVESFRDIVELEHVLHLESKITARGVHDVPLDRIFDALFPAGSITGAPKRAAVHAIRDLEAEPRGVYTGTIGFIDASGYGEWSVAIRTAIVTRNEARYHAGGGIVWESDPDAEMRETLDKARAFLLFHEQMNRERR